MKPIDPKPVEAIAAHIALTVRELHSPATLAEAFWALDGDEQVAFLESLSEFIGNAHAARLQGWYVRDSLTPECETALEMFRCILEQPDEQ